jgi:hypothetical protein
LESILDLSTAIVGSFQFEFEGIVLDEELADFDVSVVVTEEVGFKSPVSDVGGELGNSVEGRGGAADLVDEPVGEGFGRFIRPDLRRCKKFL